MNDNPLVKIFEHFGEEAQLGKLQEEVTEFIEAVRSRNIEHMEEEYADVLVCLTQFFFSKGLSESNVMSITTQKTVRTLERMKSGYYEVK